MQKTKLGISVGLMGAFLYAMGLFGGYFVAIAAVAYVLIREENMWLRKTAVKALALTFLFPVLLKVIGFVPDLVNYIDSIVGLFDGDFQSETLTKIIAILRSTVNIAQYVLFILLGILALQQSTVRLPLVDSTIDRHMDGEA